MGLVIWFLYLTKSHLLTLQATGQPVLKPLVSSVSFSYICMFYNFFGTILLIKAITASVMGALASLGGGIFFAIVAANDRDLESTLGAASFFLLSNAVVNAVDTFLTIKKSPPSLPESTTTPS